MSEWNYFNREFERKLKGKTPKSSLMAFFVADMSADLCEIAKKFPIGSLDFIRESNKIFAFVKDSCMRAGATDQELDALDTIMLSVMV